ncbi:hypothetical protein [Paenibacillus silvae]|nr:hypothetical protein [Paenibacillus silvae]
MKVKPTEPRMFLMLAKIAKGKGTLSSSLLNVYLRNYAKAVKRKRAAATTATNRTHESNNYVVIVPQRKEEWNAYTIQIHPTA